MPRTFPHSLLAPFVFVAAIACGDSTAPGLVFPELSDELKATYCVRGNLTIGDDASGTLTATDCPVEGDFVDSYLLKVRTTGQTQIVLSSSFDGILALHEVTDLATLDANLLELVDDEEAGDEELTATLVAGKTYILAVVGFDGSLGSYTLTVR